MHSTTQVRLYYNARACNSFNAFGERYPLCLEHLCLLSRCKRSLDYLNVRHVTNTCTSRGKHMYVTWQTPICYVSIHPSTMWQTPTQNTGRGRFVCIVQLLRKRKAQRTTGLMCWVLCFRFCVNRPDGWAEIARIGVSALRAL